MNVTGKVLWSQIRRHSRRVDLWIIRALILFWAIWMFQPQQVGAPPLSVLWLTGCLATSLFLSGWLAGDLSETRLQSFLDLLRMTRMGPVSWHIINLALADLKYVWVVSVRWPVLFALWYVGRLTVGQIAFIEACSLLAFLISLNIWMASVYRSGESKFRTAVLAVALAVLFDELLFLGGLVGQLLNNHVPAFGTALSAIFYSVSFTAHFARMSPLLALSWFPFGPVLFYAIISGFSMRSLQRKFREGWDTGWPEFEKVGTESPSRIVHSGNRTVWPDALAWQLVHVYTFGPELRMVKWFLYVLAAIGIGSAAAAGQEELAKSSTVVVALLGSLMAVQPLSHCMLQEIKQQTLPSLLLATGDPDAIYHGWRRGATWMALPDVAFVLLASAYLAMSSTAEAFLLLGCCWAIFLCGPLLFISALVPQTLEGSVIGIGVAFGVLVSIGIATFIGASTQSLEAGGLALAVISGLYNQLLKALLYSYWLEKRLNEM